MKQILITGGCGFIGTNLIHKLIDDNCIICIDNLITGSLQNIEKYMNHPHFTFIKHDICLPIILDIEGKIDEIYNLASIASPEKYKKYPLETLLTSLQGTQNVLDISLKYRSKLLFSSTSEIYGDPLVHPQPEEYYGNVNTMGERSCYDEGKRVSETMVYIYRQKYGLDLKIVRIFNTYGPFMDINDGRVITNFIKNICLKKPVIIYGNGEQTRSFCYIDDMVRGLIKMMESEELGPINLGNPDNEISLNKLVEVFKSLSKEFEGEEESKTEEIVVEYREPSEDDPKTRRPIITKAQEKLGWNPEIEIEEGLMRTIKYFIDNFIFYNE